jgi:hypothetical protein
MRKIGNSFFINLITLNLKPSSLLEEVDNMKERKNSKKSFTTFLQCDVTNQIMSLVKLTRLVNLISSSCLTRTQKKKNSYQKVDFRLKIFAGFPNLKKVTTYSQCFEFICAPRHNLILQNTKKCRIF